MNKQLSFFAVLLLIGGCSGDNNRGGPQAPVGNQPPSVSSIADQSVPANSSTGDIVFTVGDDNTAPDNLTISAGSDNPGLVDDAGILLGGSGTQRTVGITPTAGQTGAATISISVRDGEGVTAESIFVVTVTPQQAAFDTFLRATFSGAENDEPQSINDKEFNNDEASDFDDLVMP